MNFDNLFSQFFQDTFYTWNACLVTCILELIKGQLSNKSTEAVFHLNNKMNAPLNLNEILALLYTFSLEKTPFQLLKLVKREGCVFWDALLWLCFKLPICLFGHTRDTSIIKEKAKVIYFIYRQP